MKRSENVQLAMMGVAAFAATFAGATYFTRANPSQPAQCTVRPDGTQNCERRGSSVYVVHGGSGTAEPKKTQAAALTGNARSATPGMSNAIERGGFGKTASSAPFRFHVGS